MGGIMFSEAYAGIYKDKVHWFMGAADGVVHVTLHDGENERIFYDFTEPPMTDEILEEMCEAYMTRYIIIPQLKSGDIDGEEE